MRNPVGFTPKHLKVLRESALNEASRKIVDKLARQQKVGVDKRLTDPLSRCIRHR